MYWLSTSRLRCEEVKKDSNGWWCDSYVVVQVDGTVYGENDGYAQTKYILEKMLAVWKAGGSPKDVVRVKAYATDMKRAPEYAKAYSEFFKEIKPLFAMGGLRS